MLSQSAESRAWRQIGLQDAEKPRPVDRILAMAANEVEAIWLVSDETAAIGLVRVLFVNDVEARDVRSG